MWKKFLGDTQQLLKNTRLTSPFSATRKQSKYSLNDFFA